MAEKVELESGKEAPLSGLMEELEIFGPEPEVLDTNIGKISIEPMKMGQIRKLMALGQELLPTVFKLAEEMKATGDIGVSTLGEMMGDNFFEIVGIAIKRKPEELDEMDPDDFTRVVAKVLVVNMDFFAQKLPKVLVAAAASVQKAAQASGVGHTLSTSSSATATA